MRPDIKAVVRGAARLVEAALSGACEKAITVSQFEYEHALGLGISARWLAIIPNGKNVLLPGDPVEIRKKLRRACGFSDDVVVVGCVARLTPQKAIDHLLSVFGRLFRDLGDKARLLIVGDGELRAALRRQCAELGLDGVVC